eukprot:4550980-Pyramimonas_sp.AAC.1
MVIPGKPTDGRLPSGGLAIFAREGVGLRGPEHPASTAARRQSETNEQIAFGSELVAHRAQHVL